MTFRRLANAFLSALISPPCAVCGRVLDEPLCGAVCPRCWNSVARGETTVFRVSGSVAKGSAIGAYEGTLRDVIHVLKYDGRRSVASRLAALMATHAREVLDGADLVVPVPLHRTRQRERGFNQAEDLAGGLGLPVSCALRRIRRTRPQVELPASDRQRNVHDAFALSGIAQRVLTPFWRRPNRGRRAEVSSSRSGGITDRIIVLVDDVTTTGATLDACARVLLAAGAQEVRAVTAARVAPGPHSIQQP